MRWVVTPRSDWLLFPDVGENPSAKECPDRIPLPLSSLLHYLCCRRKKKVEVKETAQRLQDVPLHLSSDAGEWLTQNIWWSETIVFFFLSHISSPKYQTFKLWKAKGNILKLCEFNGRIRKPCLSLKLIIVQKNSRDKNVPAHLWKLCYKKANDIIQKVWEKSCTEDILWHGSYPEFSNMIICLFVFN